MKIQTTGLSLNELLKIYGTGKGGFYSNWWKKEEFADEKPKAGVYEIDFKKKLTNLTYDEQMEQLPKNQEMLHPAILAEAVLSNYKKTRKRVLEDWYSRTISVGSDGFHVYVGYFDADGLSVGSSWDAFRYDGIGGASALKSIEPYNLEPVDSSFFEARVKALEDWKEKIRHQLLDI